jgi:hypothetical protein
MKTAAEYITEQIEKNAEEYYDGEIQDAEYEFRESGEPSGLSRGMFSRHYECEEVAKVLDNGIAVGWTYWYGGGKYGEPEAIDWIDESYLLDVTQETKVVNVYKFKQQ